MFVTGDVFMWATGIEVSILLALLIPMLINVIALRGDVKPIASAIKDVNNFFMSRGLGSILGAHGSQESGQGHHSLPLEKARKRDALIAKGKSKGLPDIELDELKQLLLEDARDELRSGTISPLAFGTLATTTASIIESLSKAQASGKAKELIRSAKEARAEVEAAEEAPNISEQE